MSPAPLPTLHEKLGGRRLGLGTMSLTGPGVWGAPDRPDEARALLRHAIASGVRLVDTADSYGPEAAEALVAEALHPYTGILVATKGGFVRHGPGRWEADCRPDALRAACEGSLRRLRVDAIDLYYLHRVDPKVPLAESLGALVELLQDGKIQRIGVSNVSRDELEQALGIAPVAAVQNRFGLADRSSLDVLSLCEANGITFVAWAPLAKGGLCRPDNVLRSVAVRHAATQAQVALAWALASSPVTVPIPGTSSLRHLDENLGAVSLRLDAADLDALSRRSFDRVARQPLARRVHHRARRLARRSA